MCAYVLRAVPFSCLRSHTRSVAHTRKRVVTPEASHPQRQGRQPSTGRFLIFPTVPTLVLTLLRAPLLIFQPPRPTATPQVQPTQPCLQMCLQSLSKSTKGGEKQQAAGGFRHARARTHNRMRPAPQGASLPRATVYATAPGPGASPRHQHKRHQCSPVTLVPPLVPLLVRW